MARKPTGKPVGRPEKPIDWSIFEELCSLQCTQQEMANVFHVDTETLQLRVEKQYGDKYPVIYKRYSDGGKCSLRRYQFKQAQTNATMAIWLGKQYLDQKENNNEIVVAAETFDNFERIMRQIKQAQTPRLNA